MNFVISSHYLHYIWICLLTREVLGSSVQSFIVHFEEQPANCERKKLQSVETLRKLGYRL